MSHSKVSFEEMTVLFNSFETVSNYYPRIESQI